MIRFARNGLTALVSTGSEPVHYGWVSGRFQNSGSLILFTEEIAHPHNSIDLFRCESRQQIPPN